MRSPRDGQKRIDPERIAEILHVVRSFAYEPTLVQAADDLIYWAAHAERRRSKYRAISIAIEIYNEYGRSNKSREVITGFLSEIEKEVEATVSEMEQEPRRAMDILKQICWVYAGAAITHYWFQESEKGLGFIKRAREIIDQHLTVKHGQLEGLPCFGTQSRLTYYAALLNLQMRDLKHADENLRSSLAFAADRYAQLEREKRDNKNYWESTEGKREARYTNICVAKIQGFAAATIHESHGELRMAQFLLESAELVLRQSHSPTMAQMIRLRLCKVKRALAGRAVEKLDPIIREVKECHDAFSEHRKGDDSSVQNKFYASLSAFEIGLSSLYKAQGLRHTGQKDSPEYQEALEEAEFYATRITNSSESDYWSFSKQLLLCRIKRETDPPTSMKHADLALGIARVLGRSALIVDAYIAMGEALLQNSDYNEALSVFELAERKNQSDSDNLDRIKAICSLRKAEAFVELDRKHEAVRMLDEWKVLSKQIEFEVIHYIARKVENKLKDFVGDFHISKEAEELDFKLQSERLKEWLAIVVLRRHEGKGDDLESDSKYAQWLMDEMRIGLSTAYKMLPKLLGHDWKKRLAARRAAKRTEAD